MLYIFAMLEIKRFTVNPLSENTYVVSDNTKECVIIDCGAYTNTEKQAILSYIKSKELIPKHLLQTHGHLDHCIGNYAIFEEYGIIPEVQVLN